MAKRPSRWNPVSGQSNRFSVVDTNTGEIDLRAEFDQLIFGDADHIPHGRLVVVRHARRDSDGQPITCSCVDVNTRESTPDCAYCLGEGFLWDEEWYVCYVMYNGPDGGLSNRRKDLWPGNIRVDLKIFFFRYDVPVRYGDKIIEMKLDDEGDPIVPYIREAIHEPQTINEYRSDHGRAEYLAVYCREDQALRADEF